MSSGSKGRAAKKTKPNTAKTQSSALNKYAKALDRHTTALNNAAAAHSSMTVALKNNTAALAASKPKKTFNQKLADVADCVSQWLTNAKGVSQADSTNPAKNMAADFHIGSPQEMQLCLEAVQVCLASKSDFYHLDTTSPNANQHLNTLLTGTLGALVADIVAHTT